MGRAAFSFWFCESTCQTCLSLASFSDVVCSLEIGNARTGGGNSALYDAYIVTRSISLSGFVLAPNALKISFSLQLLVV